MNDKTCPVDEEAQGDQGGGYSEHDLRLNCLHMAHNHGDEPVKVVKRAEEYLAFIKAK